MTRWRVARPYSNPSTRKRCRGHSLTSLVLEPLDRRELLAVVVLPPSGVLEGAAISGAIATFDETDVAGTLEQLGAVVDWGDGAQTLAVVEILDDESETRTVVIPEAAAHAYAESLPSYTITVTVTGSDQTIAEGRGSITIGATIPVGSGSLITATAREPFEGTVANFSDPNLLESAANFTAFVDWGDGQVGPGRVVSDGAGQFRVLSEHVYASAPLNRQPMPLKVTIREDKVAEPIVLEGQAVVAESEPIPPVPIFGRLAPLSDTGVSSSDGITATGFPVFEGTAPPYTVVLLYGRRFDHKVETLLGRTVASADGNWQLTVGPVPDGRYTIRATDALPAGDPVPNYLYTEVQPLVIDTIGLAIVKVERLPGLSGLRVYFHPDSSGFDASTLTTATHYSIQQPGRFGLPVATARSASLGTPTSQYQTVDLTFDRGDAFRVFRSRLLSINGLRDVAGNPLGGVFPVTTHAYPTRVRPFR